MKKGNPIALLPIGVFLVIYLGLGLVFEYVLKIERGFYNIPIVIAFLVAILVACLQNRKLNFMAKQELFKNKIIGAFFRSIGAFPVNRGKGDVEAVNKAEDIVKNNGIVLIFPEGTRSKEGRVMRFKSGAAYVASLCKSDIVPAGISYEGKGLSFRKKVTVTFGKAIPNAEITIRDDHRVEDARRVNNLLRDSVLELIEKGRN